jgi:hypothetical protein
MRGAWIWGLLAVLLGAPARAQTPVEPPACGGPRITLDAALTSRSEWSLALERARQRVVELRDVDNCALLQVLQNPSEVVVRAQLPDGRAALRTVARPSDLPATVAALLLLPPAPQAKQPPPPPPAPPAPPLEARREKESTVGPLATTASATSQLGFELGVGPAGRVAHDNSYYPSRGGALFAQLRWQRWLAGLAGRGSTTWNRSGAGFPTLSREVAFTGGLTFGRRLLDGVVTLDVELELPEVSFEKISFTPEPRVYIEHEPTEPPETYVFPYPEETFSYGDVRAGALVRASVPIFRSLRLYGALDGDTVVKRFAMTGTNSGTQPSLPGWSAGLSIGLQWNAL